MLSLAFNKLKTIRSARKITRSKQVSGICISVLSLLVSFEELWVAFKPQPTLVYDIGESLSRYSYIH